MIDWNNYRRMDQTFLFAPLLRDNFYLSESELERLLFFLDSVVFIQPINSRQLAALAITTAFAVTNIKMQFKQKGTF